MEELTPAAEKEEQGKRVIRLIVIALAVVGLLTALAVTASTLYKKLKKAVAALNEDGVLGEPMNEEELTLRRGGSGGANGCTVTDGSDET